MTHHTLYPAVYMVWDHSNIEPDALVPPDAPGGPLLSYGYWITELGDPITITGYYFCRRQFRWERRDGPVLDILEAEDERRNPTQSLSFEDFPGLDFEREDDLVLRELQRVHDVHFGYRTLETPRAAPDASELAQLEALETQLDEFLSDEIWHLKYLVTEEYCLRRRGPLRWLFGSR